MSDHHDRFLSFYNANPQVYHELVALAREAKARGAKKIGIRMLWEVMRWNRLIKTFDPNDPDGWKLNDHYHSRYARAIMAHEQDLDGFFEVRELKT